MALKTLISIYNDGIKLQTICSMFEISFLFLLILYEPEQISFNASSKLAAAIYFQRDASAPIKPFD